jgi:C-terminal processing protease CtpA/Prc
VIKTGTVLKSINGKSISYYRDSLFQFLPMDGHGLINKYQTLSNIGSFSGWYRNVFGMADSIRIGYLDTMGEEKQTYIRAFDPKKDSSYKEDLMNFKKPDRKERRHNLLAASRELTIDKRTSTAVLTLNTFLGGQGLRGFIKRTFKDLHRQRISNLVVDVRNNGGGNVSISNLLTKLIIDHRFKMADSLYAINKKSRYSRYISQNFLNRLSMTIITRKHADGKYHFGYFERHYFKPKQHHHFDGNVYILTGGNSFSATSLFANFLKGQKNVLLVGEETGGGAYGNNAWLIPDVTLPNTRVRFTLPKFRMVINKTAEKTGRGVMPDVFVRSSLESIRKGIDPKMEKVKALIAASKARTTAVR